MEHVMLQLVLTNIPMDLSNLLYNLHLIHCLPKVGLHASYMLNSVLFANLYGSQGKGLRTKSLNEEKNFLFLTSLKTIDCFCSCRETNYFSKKSQTPLPPEHQRSVPYVSHIVNVKNHYIIAPYLSK